MIASLSDGEIMEFFTRIADGMTTVADLDVLLQLLEQVVGEATGNAVGAHLLELDDASF